MEPSPTIVWKEQAPSLQRRRRKYNIDKFKKCGKIKADKGITVYRLYNPNAAGGDHYYTKSKYEAQSLVNKGWKWDNQGKAVFYSGGNLPIYVAYTTPILNLELIITREIYMKKIT